MAGEISFRIRKSVSLGGVSFGTTDVTVEAAAAQAYQEEFSASQTNKLIDFVFDVTNAKIQAVSASQACTLKTNNSTTPDTTITLAKNETRIWDSRQPVGEQIFPEDVTALYLSWTQADAEDTLTLKVGTAFDATP